MRQIKQNDAILQELVQKSQVWLLFLQSLIFCNSVQSFSTKNFSSLNLILEAIWCVVMK